MVALFLPSSDADNRGRLRRQIFVLEVVGSNPPLCSGPKVPLGWW